MAAAVEPQLPSDPLIPPPPPMSTSKQNRILIWRREVASALDDAASNASSNSSSSTVTNSTAATSASGSHQAGAGGAGALSPTLANHADSPTSSFSSSSLPSSRPRALWKRLSRRLAIHHGPDSGAPVESPRTAMYRDIPPDPSLALEGLTVVDGGGADRPEVVDATAPVQPTTTTAAAAARNDVEEQHPLGAESSSDGGGRGLRERQERLQRAARLLEHGPKKDEMAPVVSVAVMN